jgi:nitrite reductase/ring-hydroxylating ferredoxin subunit
MDQTCNRRHFLHITLAALTVGELSRLAAEPPTAPSPTAPGGPMDVGLATDFPTDQVYQNFYKQGFFLIRKEGKYFALTDVCPHKGGPLVALPDGTFTCKWHHAAFDASGHVTKKPAKTDLLVYPVTQDDKGHLIVALPTPVKLPPKPKPSPTPGTGPSGTPSPAPAEATPSKAP